MKSIGVSLSVFVLAVSSAAACNGKLGVDDDRRGQNVNEGESRSTSGGGEGGATPNTTEGAGGVTTSGDFDPPVPPVSSSSEGCPYGPLEPESACETVGLTCRYYTYPPDMPIRDPQECFCIERPGDRQIWACHNPSPVNETCPNDRVWDCPVTSVELPDPPELALDPERIVAELTDEERETWCEWYARLGYNDSEPVPDSPVEDGYAIGTACMFNGKYCHANVPILSKSQCIANLSLSECESPLSTLTDCAIDVLSHACGPTDYGCFDFMEAPNCEGTIITREDGETRCDVRVE